MIEYRLSLTVVCHGCFFDKYRIDHTRELCSKNSACGILFRQIGCAFLACQFAGSEEKATERRKSRKRIFFFCKSLYKYEYKMQRIRRGVCTTYVKRNCARDSGQSLFARNGHLGT